MSKLARALLAGAVLAAMSLAGTAAAAGQPGDRPASAPGIRRPNVVDLPAQRPHQDGQDARQERAAAATAARRRLAQERSSTPGGAPAPVTAPSPADPSGRPAAPGVLVVAVALVAGVAVLAAAGASRAARDRRAGPTGTIAAPAGEADALSLPPGRGRGSPPA